MPITLGSNLASLRGQRQLSKTSTELGVVFERLSSGQRINRAIDDAAGLAIADSLRADARVFNQGVRNLNDGLSLLSIADSAIETLSGIVTRLEELAAQSANGVYSNKQRIALDAEGQALAKEFFRISKTTEFNGARLFDGENPAISLQAGVGNDAVLQASVGGAIGTGTFGGATSFLTEGRFSLAVDLGDINGDGFLDLATAGADDFSTGYATMRFGDGTGRFSAAVSFVTDVGGSNALQLGDIDGDGFLDLVTAGRDGFGNSSATIRLGNGTGSFGEAASILTGTGVSLALKLGDVNGDGLLDLVTAGVGGGGGGFATVNLGDGTGSFGAATSFTAESGRSSALNLGDINCDGILDLVTAGSDSTLINGYATVRLGDGAGGFGGATSFATEAKRSNALSLGDVNGDGFLDLVTAGTDDSFIGYATVRLGNGKGSFGVATSFATEADESMALSLGDVNGDGFLDLVTAGDGGTSGFSTVRLGDGTGSFGVATSFAANQNNYALKLGDVDGDGVLDLIVAGSYFGGYFPYTNGSAKIRLGKGVAGVAPLLEFSLKTIADARQAFPVFQRKREQLAQQRGEIGANQARIEVATNMLTVASENFRAAETRIRDADIASEAASLTRLNILQQAASSVLAQANQQPALALQLLGGR